MFLLKDWDTQIMPLTTIGTVYTKSWYWVKKKGNRAGTAITDSLSIRIGGEPNLSNKRRRQPNNRIKSTKYTLITFLPQNLVEQFRRIANFYFLIMVVVAIVIDSPVSPLTSLIPLVFVIAVTAAKQGYEDFLRYRADNMVNRSYVSVIRNQNELDVRSEDIVQGDLVKACRDCDVPCDLVLLKTSDIHGKCHITTANLDGETNLKTLTVPKGLPNVPNEKLHTLGIIECEQPKTDLYTFNGRIELGPLYRRDRRQSALSERMSIEVPPLHHQNVLPLMAENLLLRGTKIKNTEWAIGCAVYTGPSTKLALNSRLTRNKMSSSEKFVNKFLIFFLVLLITFVTASYFIKRYFDIYHVDHNIYLGDPVPNFQVSQFLQDYFSFLILFNYLIPISLYVTIEMHKFLGALFLEWDIDLYDEETDQPAIVNTSDLNEELGQVQILFSDKTGTLTKNEMIFQQCSIIGKRYMLDGTGIRKFYSNQLMNIQNFDTRTFDFFQTLAACHTVQVAGSETINDENILVPDNNLDEMKLPNGTIISNQIKSSPMLTTSDRLSSSDSERLENVTTFSDINEESDTTITANLAEIDEIDFLQMRQPEQQSDLLMDTVPNVGDKYPLLRKTPETQKLQNLQVDDDKIGPIVSTVKRPSGDSTSSVTFKLSPKIRLQLEKQERPNSMLEYPQLKSISSTLNEQSSLSLPVGRLIDFKRTISAIENDRKEYQTHRRTQSHGAPPVNRYNTASRTVSRTASLLRSQVSVTSTREYYAAPSFNEASLLERKESTRRKLDMIGNIIENLDYQASSPDEKALVEACAKVGFLYTGEINDLMTIKLRPYNHKRTAGNKIEFERLHVLEFSSDRKRMSTIVRDGKGQIWLLTKGAESHVLPLCQATNPELIAITQEHVNEFAKLGLRTLAVAKKLLTEEEYNQYDNEITEANNCLTERKENIERVQEQIERNLELLGATAVEDALQDDVRDTLVSLRQAGIKVWVLTGDKVETALNIALSCGHIPPDANKYFITECRSDQHFKEHCRVLESEMYRKPEAEYAILIDGISLALVLKNHREEFRDLAVKCHAVLCCRLSPLQKCEVVQLMKTVPGKPVTAAIGDGANDVSMIQEAHVGLGIVGKEGRQAARCADYSFANFSMVKKILLVHGHYYSQRLAVLVLYFFYKNLVFMMIQLYFQTNSMFSSQSIYDSFFLTLYNVVYTSLPVLFISLTEKVHPEKVLLRNPSLYKENRNNKRLHWQYFIGWMTIAIYHSIVIYGSAYVIWVQNNVIFTNPHTVNFSCFGTFMIHNVVFLVNLKLWLETKYQTYWFIFTVVGSILMFVITTVIYNFFDINFDMDMLWVYNNLLSSLSFWLLFLWIMIAALLPDFTIKSLYELGIIARIPNIFERNLKSKEYERNKYDQTTYL